MLVNCNMFFIFSSFFQFLFTNGKIKELFLFLQTMGRKSREKKEISILTSHTHFGALKAHGYWDEDSDLRLPIPHLEVTLYL